MVAKFSKRFSLLILTLILLGFVFISRVTYAAENYSTCTYSSGDYSSTASCDENQVTNNLSGTGSNQKTLLVLALSLIIGICGIGGALLIVFRSNKKTK